MIRSAGSTLSLQHPTPLSAGVSQTENQARRLLHDEVLAADGKQVEQLSISKDCLMLWQTGLSLRAFAGPSPTWAAELSGIGAQPALLSWS